MNEPQQIKTIDEWEQFKSDNKSLNEIIIFKFSPICAQSLDIEGDVVTWFKNEMPDKLVMVLIDVIGNRTLSMSLAEQTGVIHESPQIIWLDKDGKVKYTASHRKIDSEKLSKQLSLV